MITVDEFMTSDPYTLTEDDSLYDARKVMTEKHIRHIPITDSDTRLLGLVTQRDVLAATDPVSIQQTKSAPDASDRDIKLSDIMIREVSTIHTTDSLREAALYIQSHKYGCLPVVADNCLVGIITDSDFIDIAINLLEQVEVIAEEVAIETETEIDDVEMLAFEETQ
ncbi:MAG TPA: CBS domain-containing protein [Gammaproteobacteria bacterium]|nr:CBS domain-containing protein [Gammaproteobacteria bacterium]